MRVYVIRHGESETNLENKWTGWMDVHLTEKGKNDAKGAGEILKNVTFKKIYTSDLTRAIETAEAALPNCKYEKSALLREINVGDLAGNPLSIITDEQREIISKEGYGIFGGETKKEFEDRIQSFIKELEVENHDTVAVFSHAGWLRGMLDMVLGVAMPRGKVRCGNCTVAIFENTKGNWKLHSWINKID